MILNHQQLMEIRAQGIINCPISAVGPTSIDVTLAPGFYTERRPSLWERLFGSLFGRREVCIPARGEGVPPMDYHVDSVVVPPKAFVLASINETLELPAYLTVEVRLRSTPARAALQHALAVWCFVGDTEVAMWSGPPKQIRDVRVGDWVVSLGKDGVVRPGKVTRSGKSSVVTALVEVTLDNGKIVRCTGNHQFMLRDGTYRIAEHLRVGDAVMPAYQRTVNGRRQYYSPRAEGTRLAHQYKGRWEFAHRLAIEVPKGCVAHHKDHDETNDNPENLVIMTSKEHIAEHNRVRCRGAVHRERMKTQGALNLAKARKNPEFRTMVAERGARNFREFNRKRFADPVARAKMREVQVKTGLAAVERLRSPENQRSAMLGSIRSVLSKLAARGTQVTPATYAEARHRSAPRVATIEREFGTFEEGLREAGYVNHKVVSVKVLEVPATDVYDITVADHHNFALHDGCFVHNCDPGYVGNLTLELTNSWQWTSMLLRKGDRVAQLIFHKHEPTDKPYRGVYRGDTETRKAVAHG